MNEQELLHKPFDLYTHSTHFYNYLEVIIREDGTIEYAVPSHSKKLEEIANIKYGKDKFIEMLRDPDAFYDYIKWLCDKTNCVSVWNDFCIKPLNITEKQYEALNKLHNTYYECKRGNYLPLYQGDI